MASDRTTFIFGNGLGMALNKERFLLRNAMKEAWEKIDTDAQDLLQKTNDDKPLESEDDLRKIQEVMFAIEDLEQCELTYSKCLLTPAAKENLKSYTKFVLEVAHYFYDSADELPESFITNFKKFITPININIATLNYDKLLYGAMLKHEILCADFKRTKLCDGFLSHFDKNNLERDWNKYGWYLHLHGSPLYFNLNYDPNKYILKDQRWSVDTNDKNKIRRHLVLTSSKHKPNVISRSSLLDAYWQYFILALNESCKIVLFGYSGNDTHINEAIKNQIAKDNTTKLCIVEYKGSDDINNQHRLDFWKGKITLPENHTPQIFREVNILKFDFNKLN